MPYFPSPIDNALLHYRTYTPATIPPPFGRQNPATTKSGKAVTLVFIHGWPMSSQMYEHLLLKLCENHRLRCIASDRRGFGKSEWCGPSSQSKGDITYDTFASDTVALLEHALPKVAFGSPGSAGNGSESEDFVFVASSMGCAETLLAYNMLNADLKKHCLGFIWLGPSMPYPLRTEAHPEGPPRELWDFLVAGFRSDRVGFAKASLPGVFGVGEQFGEGGTMEGMGVTEGHLEWFGKLVGQSDAVAVERCVGIMTGRDMTEELKQLGRAEFEGGEGWKKVLVLHGERDQGMFMSCSHLSSACICSMQCLWMHLTLRNLLIVYMYKCEPC
jgi:non-heme chloroperoxidase